ncbi:hypothetical protein TPA0908_38140 [Micromonospora sp. AKA38]|nr:hypothetical protein TPA0908_38140 [Micromonospora sp. AKA38]
MGLPQHWLRPDVVRSRERVARQPSGRDPDISPDGPAGWATVGSCRAARGESQATRVDPVGTLTRGGWKNRVS